MKIKSLWHDEAFLWDLGVTKTSSTPKPCLVFLGGGPDDDQPVQQVHRNPMWRHDVGATYGANAWHIGDI